MIKDTTYKKYCLIIDEWAINGFNGTKAVQKLYPTHDDNSAGVKFNEILRITKIADYVKEKHKQAQIHLQTSHEKLLEELRNWAYSDITETLSLDIDDIKKLPIEIRRLITKYKKTSRDIKNKKGEVVETVETVELWFVSKEKAMEMIHKHTGFYEKDNEQKSANIKLLTNDPIQDNDSTSED